MSPCALAQFSDTPCRHRADGQPDRAHLIKQQRLKRALKSRGLSKAEIQAIVWDERIWVWACRKHHSDFDELRLVLLESDYPASVHEFAADHGFVFIDARRGWIAGPAVTQDREAA